MSTTTPKVFIQIESSAEQQENLKNSRKTLKVLQSGATDKENLAGRPIITGKSSGFKKSKSEVDFKFGGTEFLKRKKIEAKSIHTQTGTVDILSPATVEASITVEDLTTSENPGEAYWKILAEKRRNALEETLEENKNLHDRIEGLESELDTSKQMLDEARNLVEILQEMLEENEAAAAAAANNNNETTDDFNIGASTSGDVSKYFDADSCESPTTKVKSNIPAESDDED